MAVIDGIGVLGFDSANLFDLAKILLSAVCEIGRAARNAIVLDFHPVGFLDSMAFLLFAVCANMLITTAPTALFMGMGSQNVNTVLIAGKVMKRNGQLLDVDFDRLARHDARDRLYASANVKNTRI